MLEWGVVIVIAVAVALVVRATALETFTIPTASMEPTLNVGDRILVAKAFFNWHDVHEGEIVVFTHPPRDTDCVGPPNEDLVKRVIALPGQTISSRGNTIYIDGRRLSEPYLPTPDPLGPAIASGPNGTAYRVPAGEFFVMGDNRAISCDSRSWGPIKGSTIVGDVVLRFWHNGRPDFHLF